MVRLFRLEGVAPDFVGRRRSGLGPASASALPARSLTVLAGWSPVRSGGSGPVGGAGGPGATGGRGRLRLPPRGTTGASGLAADRLERVSPLAGSGRSKVTCSARVLRLVSLPSGSVGWSPVRSVGPARLLKRVGLGRPVVGGASGCPLGVLPAPVAWRPTGWSGWLPWVPDSGSGLVDLGGASGCPLVPVPCWPTGWSGTSPGSSGGRSQACSPRILRLVSPVPSGSMGCSSPARPRRTGSVGGAGMAGRQVVSSMLAAGVSSTPAAKLARGSGHGVSGSGTGGNHAWGMGRDRCSSLAGVGALEAGVNVGSLTRAGAGG